MIPYHRRFFICFALACAGGLAGKILVHPQSRAVATLLLVASAVLLGITAYRLHQTRHERSFLKNALIVYTPYAVVALLLTAALRIGLILAPPGVAPLAELEPAALDTKLYADYARLSDWNAKRTEALRALHAAGDADNRNALRKAWAETLDLYTAYGQTVDTYTGFHRIDYVTQPAQHTGALIIGLWACIGQQAIASDVAFWTENRPALRQRLDHYVPHHGSGNATEMIRSMGSDTTLLRIHAGAAYFALIAKDTPTALTNALPAFRAELLAAQRASGTDALRAITDPLQRLKALP